MLGRLLGYMANRGDRLSEVLENEHTVIRAPATPEPSGYGLGFYQGGEVLHKKRPLIDGLELDWGQVARDVRTDAAIFHLRRGTVGAFRIDNTHPFRMRSWLFAHNGTIERFEAVQERLLEQLPDFIRRNVRGQTDSEHFFHLILSFLHDAGQLDNPDVDDDAVRTALRSAVAMIDRFAEEVGAEKPVLNCVLTNGRRMYGLRRGQPMMYAERDGEPASDRAMGERGLRFRYVMIVGGVETVPRGYHIVENNHVVIVDRNLNVSVQTL